ncbi:Uncharacterized protein HZ326_16707 [Fusarium oxysporum f. sp. albedinis]|nr:Uncharacterized protein HZ326_16707 [Fusarium oxysporum f. sp. albedinis]
MLGGKIQLFSNQVRYGVVANISRSHNLRDQYRGAQGSIPCTGDLVSFWRYAKLTFCQLIKQDIVASYFLFIL